MNKISKTRKKFYGTIALVIAGSLSLSLISRIFLSHTYDESYRCPFWLCATIVIFTVAPEITDSKTDTIIGIAGLIVIVSLLSLLSLENFYSIAGILWGALPSYYIARNQRTKTNH
jgi:hypothetical protein